MKNNDYNKGNIQNLLNDNSIKDKNFINII